MFELFAGLLSIGMALGLLALLGHGLWLLGANILRGLHGLGAARGAERRCPRCDAALGTSANCAACAWPFPPRPTNAAASTAGLRGLRSHFERLLQAGAIDLATHAQLCAVLDENERRLAAPVATAAGAVAAARPTPAIPLPVAPCVPAAKMVTEAMPVAEAMPAAAAMPTTPTEPRGLAERARQFAARQQAARSAAPALPPAPARPTAKPLSQLLSAFLEEKNIRWGELAGGLLIVGCSIALVISFWGAIAERPFLKFVVFGGVTASVFAAGLYTERRWKLPTTSRGLFVIGSLLVPLNFLAIAALQRGATAPPASLIVGEALTIALFAWLLTLAGRNLAPSWPRWLAVGVLVPSALQLLIRRFGGPEVSATTTWALAGGLIAPYLAAGLAAARGREIKTDDEDAWAAGPLRLLGVTSFAVLVSLGLLLVKTERPGDTLRLLAPAATLLAAPAWLVGLSLWKGARQRTGAAFATTGAALAVAAAGVSFAGIVGSWPSPPGMIGASLATTALMVAAALTLGIAPAWLPACACAVWAYLLIAHRGLGNIAVHATAAELTLALLSAITGNLLIGPVLVLVAAAFALRRRGQSAIAPWIERAALGAGIVSVALVGWFGLGREGDPHRATWSLLAYALLVGAAAIRLDRGLLAGAAALLGLAAAAQGCVFGVGQQLSLEHPWTCSLLLTATACGIAACLRGVHSTTALAVFAGAAQSMLVAATPLIAWVAVMDSASAAWPFAAWGCAAWLAVGMARRDQQSFVAGQAALVATVVLAVGAALEPRAWFQQADWPWLDPWTFEALGLALAALALSWQGLRFALRGRGPAEFLNQQPALDRMLHVPIVLLMFALAAYAALPSAAQELTPRLAAQAWSASADTGRIVPALQRFELAFAPSAHAAGWGGWALAVVVAVQCGAQWLERRTLWSAEALVLALWTFCLWGASLAVPDMASATALRWLSAGFVLLVALGSWRRRPSPEQTPRTSLLATAWPFSVALGGLAWLLMGGYVAALAVAYRPLPPGLDQALAVTFGLAAVVGLGTAALHWTVRSSSASALVGVLGALPLVATLLYAVTVALQGNPIVGPDPASWAARMGLAASYTGPIVLVALALLSESVRRRSEGYAFAAGLLVNVAATAGYLLALRGTMPFDAVLWVRLAQLNAAVAAMYGLSWWAALHWKRPASADPSSTGWLLDAQLRLGAAIVGAALALLTLAIWFHPISIAAHLAAGSLWGWSSVALAVGAFSAAEQRLRRPLSAEPVVAVGGLAVCMIANTLAPWDVGQWLVYHALTVGWLVLAAVLSLVAVRRAEANTAGRLEALVAATGLAALAFAVRGLVDDPQGPWWTAGAFVGCAVLSAWLGARRALRSPLWLSAGLLNAATSLVWWKLRTPGASDPVLELALVNAIALAVPTALWLLLELRSIRPRLAAGAWGLEMHRAAATSSLAVLGTVAALGLWADALGRPLPLSPWLVALGWLTAGIAGLSCLWDGRARWSVLGVYLLGVTGLALLLDSLDVTGDRLVWSGALMAAAYSVAASYVWSRREGLQRHTERLGMPIAAEEAAWIVPATAALGAAASALSFLAVLTFDDPNLRISAAQAILAQGVAFGFLADGRRRNALLTAALAAVAVGCVALGWATVSPNMPGAWLHRGVTSLVALALVATAYGLGLAKLLRADSDWVAAAQRLVPWLLGGASLALVRVLGTEALYYLDDAVVPMTPLAIAAVGAAIVGLAVAALAAALLPGRDPLGLSERGRTVYVYAAEALLALAFLHVRLTMPWLFSGFWRAWWPFLAMFVAFAGVGLSELFRRLRQQVLAEPLERTAVFLPLLPVLGFWTVPSNGHFSLLLLSVGGLYGALALLRRSLGFGVLALVATHGGFWYFLSNDTGLQLLQHPQLWLIPPAICTLVGAYLNRERLTAEQMTQIRYLASTVIYASSTAEMFITGVAQAPWLPLVLAGLSLAGLFAGILLRVRAFLYLGSTFLTVSLLAVIWHAAHDLDQTWIWYASGIVVGALIIALFATFEKKRHEVLALVDRVRSWEG